MAISPGVYLPKQYVGEETLDYPPRYFQPFSTSPGSYCSTSCWVERLATNTFLCRLSPVFSVFSSNPRASPCYLKLRNPRLLMMCDIYKT